MNTPFLYFFKKNIIILSIIIIILIGFSLRIIYLDEESLWTDEAFSVSHAQKNTSLEVIIGVSETEAAPPLYYILLHYWIIAFGNSENSVRTISAISGTLSVVVVVLIAYELFDANVALISSLLISTSMLQIVYSQDARQYALFGVISLTSTYFFIKFLKEEQEKRKWTSSKKTNLNIPTILLYIISIVLGIYTNYMTVFLICGYTVITLNHKFRNKLRIWLIANSVVAILSLPVLPILRTQFLSIGLGASETFKSLGVPTSIANLGVFMFVIPVVVILIFLGAITLLKDKLHNIDIYKFPKTIFIIILVLWGVIYIYLSFCTLEILGIPIVKVPIIQSYFLIRHSFFLAPLAYVLVAHYIIKSLDKRLVVLSVLVILVVNFIALTAYYSQTTKPQWKEATNYIFENSLSNRNSHDSPLILLDRGGSSNVFLFEYYYPGSPKIVRLTQAKRGQPLTKMLTNSIFEVIEKEESGNPIWLVLSKNRESEEMYKEIMINSYIFEDSLTFYGVEVYKFKTQKLRH